MTEAFNDFFWHDGLLSNISFEIDNTGKSVAVVSASFYRNEQDKERYDCQIRCEDVSRFNTMIDAEELKNNMFAGTISNGYVKENTLWVYVTDGVVEVHAEKFRLIEL